MVGKEYQNNVIPLTTVVESGPPEPGVQLVYCVSTVLGIGGPGNCVKSQSIESAQYGRDTLKRKGDPLQTEGVGSIPY